MYRQAERTLLSSSKLLGAVILVLILFAPHSANLVPLQADQSAASYVSDCDRLGFGVASQYGEVDQYGVARLNAGWYVDWWSRLDPIHPAGLGYLQVIQTNQDTFQPGETTLIAIATANPGATWSVGNEPECIWQGNSTPEQYVRLYHRLYTLIKMHDPTARITVGGIVQVTPLRLQWLDQVLALYQAEYGRPLPVDLWNIHTFILREERDSWGCGIPAGLDANTGRLWEIQDHDRIDIIQDQVVRFRQWMKDNGQRDQELIITEYGILMPDQTGYDFTVTRVQAFMRNTFDYFMTATDPELGCPSDGNRLVQRWAWYSLNDPLFEGFISRSHLFEPATRQITPLGLAFEDYVRGLSCPSYVDLVAARLDVDRSSHWAIHGQPPDLTLTATVRNAGNTNARNVSVLFWTGDPAHPLGGEQLLATLPARSWATLSVDWPGVPVGRHAVGVTVDVRETIAEPDETNNQLSRDLRCVLRRPGSKGEYAASADFGSVAHSFAEVVEQQALLAFVLAGIENENERQVGGFAIGRVGNGHLAGFPLMCP